MYWSRNGVDTLSMHPWHYSLGSRSNKNVIQAKYEMACCLGVPVCDFTPRQCRVDIGMGLTL